MSAIQVWIVECDRCGDETPPFDTRGEALDEAAARGWGDGDNAHLCRPCQEAEER